ncbi:6933_t:CDS:2 [Scutellospora calospora]|uniref:6933_t:CDS:1 n=1 Tax=Scutellospora calospora TaxID=85575 RepID=A0ACA9JUE5_9GLOM|nr:6933_t:CDS:2 [Scutellospora calospora]
MFYQTNNDYELELKETFKTKESFFENIEKFQRIFTQHTINERNEEQEINEELITLLDQQEKEAFFLKLRILVCCKTKKCLTKINQEFAFQIFDNIQKLSKTEYNMFILGMLHVMARSKDTLFGKEKQYLTVKYTLNDSGICEKAFQTIYSLSDKKWKSIRNHYQINGIKPIVHALSGRRSHNALSFATILNILTFIINYANCHGLPSPGRHFRKDTIAITYLSASESYVGLYRIYQSSLDEISEFNISRWSFIRIWKKYIPEIRFLSPRNNLCMLCKNMRFNAKFWIESE